LDAKLIEKLDELLKKLDVIGRSTLIGENDAVYYKSMITEFD
jgi:metal-responsive CopG/Arc/MetJ family transcriptional regulator